MVTSISSAAGNGYASALATKATPPDVSAAAPAGTAAGPASSTPAVSISLSPNARRLQAAEANLDTLQAGGSLKGVWDADVKGSLLGLNTEGPADAQVAAIPTSDKDHLQQAQQAQAYVKAAIVSGGASVFQPNPFSSFSYKSLAAIVTDKAGSYTDYEKSAAFYAFNDKQNAWVVPLTQQA